LGANNSVYKVCRSTTKCSIRIFTALAAALIVDCGGPSASSGLHELVQPPPPPPPTEHLFVSFFGNSGGGFDIYSLPLTKSSTPQLSITSTLLMEGLAVEPSGELLGAANFDGVAGYTRPIVAGTSPAFVASISGFTVSVDGAGDLFDGGGIDGSKCGGYGMYFVTPYINVSYAPISGSSTATATMTEPSVCNGPLVQGLAFDGAGNLWAAITGRLDEFTPPFASTSTPTETISTCANAVGFDSAKDMFVLGCDGIDVYHPPFRSGMTKAYTISGAEGPGSIAFDRQGYLYVAAQTGLEVFTPPFSSSSQPAVTLSGDFLGIAIGS
jgi:hypothetical protein